MGGKRRTMLQQQMCSVSRALWPRDVRYCVPTGKAAQSKRLLIMNGVYLTRVKVKRRRYCAHCNSVIEYVSYVSVTRQPRFARVPLYKQAFYLSIISALLAAGICLTILIVHHWSLVLLLALVWLMTAYITSRLLASDMRLLKSVLVHLHSFCLSIKLWYNVFIHSMISVKPSFLKKRSVIEGILPLTPRMVMPSRFPETPMPATPLIRVLETIDLSSTNIEHFLEEEKQTSAEFPAIHEFPRVIE
jgi:hypothetical protein